jgi:DNA-binding MarR family transcriptional regulator
MHALAADLSYRTLLSPAVLLFGDDPARRAALAEGVQAAGGRVVTQGSIDDAAARIPMQASAAGVIVDVRSDGGAVLDRLLERLHVAGEVSGRMAAIVIIPVALIDVVTARLAGSGTEILVDPGNAEIGAAVAQLVAPPSPWVAEGAEASNRRLAELSEEVGRIARTLAQLSGDDTPRTVMPSPARAEDGPMLRAFIRLRRMRGQHFLPALFADPAWDILLDLAAARIEGRVVAVSSLCIAAAVPATTALRWITHMTEQALLVRKPDPADGRRVFIALSDEAAAGIDGYLAAARKVVAPVG